jgi:uncharacterized protein
VAFLDVDVKGGTVTRTRVGVGEYNDSTEVTLPVVMIGGGHDGPTLYVQAGLHGDEQTGIAICRTFLAQLSSRDLSQISGRVVVVPIANPPSHLSHSRGFLNEERRMVDLNRIFPGDRHGLLSERLAAVLFEEFVAPSDFTVDLHAALDGCTIAPFVYIDPDDDDAGTLALRERVGLAFGTQYVYYRQRGKRFGTSDISRGLMAQADRAGKAAITAEMGQSQIVTQEYVPIGVTGLFNVMGALGMLEPPPAPSGSQRRFSEITLVHASRGGGLHPEVTVGAEVVAGQVLGRMLNAFGEVVEELQAPESGFILRQMQWGTAASGAEAFWIAS